MEVVIIWLALAIAVAFLADSRGRSWFGFFLLSVVLSPLLGLILVLVTANLKEVEAAEQQRTYKESVRERQRREDHERHLESIKAIAMPQTSPQMQQGSPILSVSVADEIRKLGELRNEGLLTEAEFQQQKIRLLAEPSKRPNHSSNSVVASAEPSTAAGYVAALAAAGCQVTQLEASKWEICPPSGGKAFAYSEADLRRNWTTYAKPPSAPIA